MPEFKRILVGHDLKSGGETALESAVSLGQKYGAEIRLVHVIEPYHVSQRLLHLLTPPYSLEELTKRAETKLAVQVANNTPSDVRIDYDVGAGKPFVELIRKGRDWQADLLVIGRPSHEQEHFLGSSGERVVRKARLPVLVSTTAVSSHAKTFLVPVDFSDCSANAARVAASLAERFAGRLLFVHTLELARLAASHYFDESESPPAPQQLPPSPEKFGPAWDTFVSSLSLPSGVPWATQVFEGRAATEICHYAQQSHADLIVMGTHGAGAVDQMLIGSVAEEVIRTASCPVLTVRPDTFRFELP